MAHAPRLDHDDLQRLADALRYMGRDLHQRSYGAGQQRRELLWREMDACLALAERLEAPLQHQQLQPTPPERRCTLITGASSGIGLALARALAAEPEQAHRPLVLTARRLDRLQALAAKLQDRHGLTVHAIAQDLAHPDGPRQLLAELSQRQLSVHTLVNNAGFGLGGRLAQQQPEALEAMLQLQIHAAVELCHGVLPAMEAHGEGRILQVASLAGLTQGLPGSCLYSASKAFLIHFSQSLALESSPQGIRVLALCPGYVRSEFHAVLGVEQQMRNRLPGLLWMEAPELARQALKALAGQRVVVVPGRVNRWIALLLRLLPDQLGTRLTSGFSRRYRRR
jgi:short-subunit dehydrogenase